MSEVDDAFRAAESLDADDRMRLIARLWESLPEDYFEEPVSLEPVALAPVSRAPTLRDAVRVEAKLAPGDTLDLAALARDFTRNLFRPPATPSKDKIYSAPRRFDLATIFVVTSAYSLLFGVMSYVTGYMELPPAISLYVGGFITFVGVGQAALYGGQNARVASVLTGAVLAVLMNMTVVLWPPRGFSSVVMFIFTPFYAAIGAGCGYLAGVLVGGVFLVADELRTHFNARAKQSIDESAESTEIDADQDSHITA